MDLLEERFAIRKYTSHPVERADLELIMQAGEYAPTAGGGMRSMMVGVHDVDLVRGREAAAQAAPARPRSDR